MEDREDIRALSQWNKSDISYQNYIEYIEEKTDKFGLSIIDLFYIKNFKGGSATINEPEEVLRKKLLSYTKLLKKINRKFEGRKLSELNNDEEIELIKLAEQGLELVNPNNNNKIDGFSSSFLTTLLHFYFPNLYPILDRRVLNGLNLVLENDLYKNGQVKRIERFYPSLIKSFKNKSKSITIREFDKQLFIQKIK